MMSVTGHVENGVVVFDADAALPDGTKVVIAPVQDEQESVRQNGEGWKSALQAARELENYDYDAWRKQRDYSLEACW
jgi:hypothetical protein